MQHLTSAAFASSAYAQKISPKRAAWRPQVTILLFDTALFLRPLNCPRALLRSRKAEPVKTIPTAGRNRILEKFPTPFVRMSAATGVQFAAWPQIRNSPAPGHWKIAGSHDRKTETITTDPKATVPCLNLRIPQSCWHPSVVGAPPCCPRQIISRCVGIRIKRILACRRRIALKKHASAFQCILANRLIANICDGRRNNYTSKT